MLLAIITPIFYLLGYSYRSGYLNVFGLHSGYINFSTYGIYVSAYVVSGVILLDIEEFIHNVLLCDIYKIIKIFILFIPIFSLVFYIEQKHQTWNDISCLMQLFKIKKLINDYVESK